MRTTTLETSKQTEGFWEKKVIYDWSIDKYVIENEEVSVSDAGRLGTAIVPEGETVTVDYLLDERRYGVEETEMVGVSGYACVKNTGDGPTENLAIVDHLQVYDEEAGAYVDRRCSASIPRPALFCSRERSTPTTSSTTSTDRSQRNTVTWPA